MRIFVTGATGLVGRRVIQSLQDAHDITALSRDAQKLDTLCSGIESIEGDVTTPGDWQERASSADAVIHLAGAGILDKRWSPTYKEVLRRSRIESTRRVAELAPKLLINASATGIYGDCGDQELTEPSPAVEDFLGTLCKEWEEAAHTSTGRVACLRFGMVLDSTGGAFAKMKWPFLFGLGGRIGNGHQYWPWIHWVDVCRVVHHVLTSEISGSLNVVAPESVTCNTFVHELGKSLKRPTVVPMPRWLLKLLIGEGSCVLTSSQRVLPCRLLDEGFTYTFPTLSSTFNDLV